jgi:hypothetical protein
VRTDRSVWCLGLEAVTPAVGATRWVPGQSAQVPGLTGATRVGVGGFGACAVRDDGSVWCWDVERWNRGRPSQDPVAAIQVPGVDHATDVALGATFACALRDDGSVRCWGENTNGQLGNGTRSQRACDGAACFSASATPVVGLERVLRVSAGGDTACALRADGTVWCWGANANGQLGDGTQTGRTAPVRVPGLSAVRDIATSGLYTCTIEQSDKVWGWGWPGGKTSPGSTTPVAFRAPQ